MFDHDSRAMIVVYEDSNRIEHHEPMNESIPIDPLTNEEMEPIDWYYN